MSVADTSFLIDILRGRDDAKQVLVHLLASKDRLFVPAPVVQELYLSAGLARHPRRERRRIDELLAGLPCLPFDEDLARSAGLLEARLERAGRKAGWVDVQIATTALARGQALVTRDARLDVEGLDAISYG